MLEKEIETFNKERSSLLLNNPGGGFVVIKDSEILGIWNDRLDAIKEGIKKWGNVTFLVKALIESQLSDINFSRNITF